MVHRLLNPLPATLLAALLLWAGCPDATAAEPALPAAPPLPAGPPPDQRMAWFRQAKYGLFIHWGLYAIPAGEWKGKPVRPSSEWIMAHVPIPVQQYEQLAGQFNPTEFNAEQWVKMTEDAGMKYIVITAKHGDGFAMYRSKVSAYNIVDATPFRRDPLAELAEACKQHQIKLGIYYSQSVDWHEPGGEGNSWDFPRDGDKDQSGAFDRYLTSKVQPQVRELLTNYGPICEIFFDTPALMTEQRARPIADLVRTLQPACLIDGRLGVTGDYQTMGDNGMPTAEVKGDWETPGELNHNWGFDKNDADYKSPSQVLFNLLDVVSKGGNTVAVTSPRVPKPKIVRFGWDEAAQPNLFNKAGLPAIPFRTDAPFAPFSQRKPPSTTPKP